MCNPLKRKYIILKEIIIVEVNKGQAKNRQRLLVRAGGGQGSAITPAFSRDSQQAEEWGRFIMENRKAWVYLSGGCGPEEVLGGGLGMGHPMHWARGAYLPSLIGSKLEAEAKIREVASHLSSPGHLRLLKRLVGGILDC